MVRSQESERYKDIPDLGWEAALYQNADHLRQLNACPDGIKP